MMRENENGRDGRHRADAGDEAKTLKKTPLLVVSGHDVQLGLVARPTWVRLSRPRTSRTSMMDWYWVTLSPLRTIGRSGFCALSAPNRCSSSWRVTGTVSRKILPWLFTVIALVFGFARLGAALALGRLTFTPWTDAVVIRMKMTSSTYARSSIGVMLMSS